MLTGLFKFKLLEIRAEPESAAQAIEEAASTVTAVSDDDIGDAYDGMDDLVEEAGLL